MNVFLLSAVRSGSTLLLQLLQNTNLFQYPAAHSNHPSLIRQREYREFLAPNPTIDPFIINNLEKTKERCIKYLRYKLSFMKEDQNLFKILMEQWNYYMLEDADRPLIEEMIPDLKYIWLERDNIIDRTVSTYLFFQLKVDHLRSQSQLEQYLRMEVPVNDHELLNVYKKHVKRCSWGKFLEGTKYHKVEYDELVVHPTETLEKCLDFLEIDHKKLGIDIQAIVDKQPKFKTERPESFVLKAKLKELIRKTTL